MKGSDLPAASVLGGLNMLSITSTFTLPWVHVVPTSMEFYAGAGNSAKILWMVHFWMPLSLCNSSSICHLSPNYSTHHIGLQMYRSSCTLPISDSFAFLLKWCYALRSCPVWRGIIPDSFYKLSQLFFSIENGYFDIRALFNLGYIHPGQC